MRSIAMIQVLESKWFGIKTIAINEDTPCDADLWKVSHA